MERLIEQEFFKYLKQNLKVTTLFWLKLHEIIQKTEYSIKYYLDPAILQAYLYIAMQAVLALIASWLSKQVGKLLVTSMVPDSEDSVTPAPPMAEGHVIGCCGEHIPITE